MDQYRAYFDRQSASPNLHEKLLAIGRQPRTGQRHRPVFRTWRKWGALAACCALVLGLGLWQLGSRFSAAPRLALPTGGETSSSSAGSSAGPESGQGTEGDQGFLVEGRGMDGNFDLPSIPYVNYQSVDGLPTVDGALARHFLEGSFAVDLTKEEVQEIFWGPAGKPEEAEGDLPWMLFWSGYTLSGSALYSGQGELLWATLRGDSAGQGISFTLTLRPGELPFRCGLYSDLETTEVNDVPVIGWSCTEDLDGDGDDDVQCVSEFMAGDTGVRFEVRCTAGEDPMDAAVWYSSLLVRQALADDGGVYLDHLLTNSNIPAWRTAEFSSLEEARQETAFAPYLPQANIPGYGEFSGYLTYQAGNRNRLSVYWFRGYDQVSLSISLPEVRQEIPAVDVNRPETYDVRRYPIPWSESVPEEYRDTVDMPTFRAEDMSLAVVEARGHEKDTGGLSFRFGVLQGHGVLVEYHCDGLSARQVWELVQETSGLEKG